VGNYYNIDSEEKKPREVNDTATRNAIKLVSKERYKQLADINKESLAGGLGFGVAGYVIAKSKGKNVLIYTAVGTLVGFMLFNFIFRKTLLSKIESQKPTEPKKEEEKSFEGKRERERPEKRKRRRVSRPNLNEVRII